MKFLKYGSLVLSMAMIMGLSGCGGSVEFAPTQTSIFIQKDRTISSAEIESFDNSGFDTPRYDAAELQQFVEEAVSAYNSEKAGTTAVRVEEKSEETLPVAIEKLEVKDNVATLILNYAGTEEYLEFNGTTDYVAVQDLIVGTVADGNTSGLDYAGMVKADGTAADAAEIKEEEKYSLVSVTGDVVVKVEGKVQYMSSGVTLIDENTVQTPEGTSYIVFK